MDNRAEVKRRLAAYLAEKTAAAPSRSIILGKIVNLAMPMSAGALGAVASVSAPAMLANAFARRLFEKVAKNDGETFSEMLLRLVKESGEKNSASYTRANIDRQLFSKIKKNKDYQPGKDTVVALALALKLDFDKAKDFLAAAGYALTNSTRDLIISFFMENKIFDTFLLDDCLAEYKQACLFGR